MALSSFTCYDTQKELFLEFGLTTWTSYHPSLNICIRPKSGGYRGATSAYLQVQYLNSLIANVTNPSATAMIQYGGRNSNNSGTVGRSGNDFQIMNQSGTVFVTLEETQWNNLIQYLTLMYNYAPLIKEIGNCVRMHMIDLLRQVGVDQMDPSTNRYRTTMWYSSKDNANNEDGPSYGNNNNNRGNYGNNPPQQHTAPSMPPMMGNGSMPPMNTPPTGNMPPMAPLATPPGSVPNMGVPMPPFTPTAPNSGMQGLVGGMQNMLNNAFVPPNQQQNPPKQ